MPVTWSIEDAEFRELVAKFSAVNIEGAVAEGVLRTAEDMQEAVRQAVVAHPDIQSPANLISQYDGGPGPPMAQTRAWQVIQLGDGAYEVRPHPQVRQRAVILEFGSSSPIVPRNANALRFNVNGVPVFADSVSGIEARRYWRSALRKVMQEDRLAENIAAAVEDEFDDKL